MYRRLLSLLLICYLPMTHAASGLQGYTAHYDVKRNGMTLGVSERQLVKQSDTRFIFTSRTRASGLVGIFVSDVVTEQSTIDINGAELRPLNYIYAQTGSSKKKNIEIDFDWQNLRLVHSALPGLNQFPAGAHDLLSYQLAVGRELLAGNKSFSITVVDHKRIRTHSLRVAGTETFTSKQGEVKTIRLDEQAEGQPYRFIFWIAPDLNYLPVKISKVEHDGDKVTLILRQYNGKKIKLTNSADDDD
ncbi:MAG: DUF3108 domain-containing protein [Gammaproteobacteria bacterium]|nr:DUF3108 domain-containing protein [Gammaproteobacteria bacterium]MDH5650980.1 DUF3108 domain-containing protein [Gammaproteobacteria bacterium]